MPIAKLEFKLPEEESEFKLAQGGRDYYCILVDILNELRNHRKYDKPLKDTYEAIEAICQEVDTDI
jgi:hypothetical protein